MLISFISLTVVETFIKRRLDAKWWAFEILYFSIAGVIVSLAAWWKNEANYRNAKIDARIKPPESE